MAAGGGAVWPDLSDDMALIHSCFEDFARMAAASGCTTLRGARAFVATA